MLYSNFLESHVCTLCKRKKTTTAAAATSLTTEWKKKIKKDSEKESSFIHKVKLIIDSYGCYKLIIMFHVWCEMRLHECDHDNYNTGVLLVHSFRTEKKQHLPEWHTGHLCASTLPKGPTIMELFIRKLRGWQN